MLEFQSWLSAVALGFSVADRVRSCNAQVEENSVFGTYILPQLSLPTAVSQTGLDGPCSEPLLGLMDEEIQGKSWAGSKVPLDLSLV